MARKLQIKYWLPALIVLVVAAVTFLNRTRAGDEEAAGAVKRARAPVRTVVLEPTTLVETVEHTAVLRPRRDVTLTAEVAGAVTSVPRELGEPCAAGAVLLQIDPSLYRIAHQEAEAGLRMAKVQLAQAERDHARAAQLRQGGVATGQDEERARYSLEVASATVMRAEAARDMALRNLRQASVRCPFDGVVARLLVEPGQLVGPQTPLARLVDVTTLEATLAVSATSLARLEAGQEVDIVAADDPRRTGRAVVAHIGPAADAAARSFPVELRISSPGALRAGEIVRAAVTVAEHEHVLVAPQQALQQEGATTRVLVVEHSAAEWRAVETGARAGGRVVLAGGVAEGDVVVIVGQQGLATGDAVEVTQSPASPPRSAVATTGAGTDAEVDAGTDAGADNAEADDDTGTP